MMANDRKKPRLKSGDSPELGALSNILADMLRSALAWEEQHGIPPSIAESKNENMVISTKALKIVVDPGGKQDDDNFTPNNKTDK